MKEDFLHYVWQFKKFRLLHLFTTGGEPLQVINTGQYLQTSGPDFFNARISIGGQVWAGNVEIHIRSSDWYLHSHERDAAYDNVILHVVWEHDTDVVRRDNTTVPVLELKELVDPKLLINYNTLASAKTWIYCERELEHLDNFVLSNWKERLFFERLERKATPILQLAADTGNDWEAVLFCFLAKNFGLNTNGQSFFEMATSLPFNIVRKEGADPVSLEALLLGRTGLLNTDYQDLYPKQLKQQYDYIKTKHRLDEAYVRPLEFFRHRPDNFPTIRLSQLAQLYHLRHNLFTAILECNTPSDIAALFKVKASPYWDTHYVFDKESPKKAKPLTASFIDLLTINTIVPFRFAYAKYMGKDASEGLLKLMEAVKPERNNIIEKFQYYKLEAKSAYDSQALLQLKNEYCGSKRCLQCGIGLELLKK